MFPKYPVHKEVRTAATAAFDQVVSSGTNALMVFAVAISSGASEFGFMMIAYATFALLLVMSRNIFGVVLSLAARSGSLREEVGSAITLILLVSPLIVTAIAVAPLIAGASLKPIFLVFAVSGLVGLLQDTARYGLVALEKPGIAVLGDLVWLGFTLAGFMLHTVLNVDATGVVLSWGVGATASAAFLVWNSAELVKPFRAVNRLRSTASLRANLGSAAVFNSASVALTALILARTVGPEVSGAIAAAGQLMAPTNMAASMLGFVLLPISSTLGARESVRLFVIGSCVVFLTSLLWLFGLVLLPHSVGILILGDTWRGTREVLPIAGVSYAFVAVGAGGASLLTRLGGSRAIAVYRAIQGVFRIAAYSVALWFTARPPLIVLADLLTSVLFAGLVWCAVARSGQRGDFKPSTQRGSADVPSGFPEEA